MRLSDYPPYGLAAQTTHAAHFDPPVCHLQEPIIRYPAFFYIQLRNMGNQETLCIMRSLIVAEMALVFSRVRGPDCSGLTPHGATVPPIALYDGLNALILWLSGSGRAHPSLTRVFPALCLPPVVTGKRLVVKGRSIRI